MKSIRMYQLKVLTVIATLIAILIGVSQANANPAVGVKVPPSIQVSLSQDVEVYEILAYEDINISSEFKNLRDRLKSEGRLLQATTSIKKFKGHNKFIFSHQLVAMKEQSPKLKAVPQEFITYLTDVKDQAEIFAYNSYYEEGFKVQQFYKITWAGGVEMYMITLRK